MDRGHVGGACSAPDVNKCFYLSFLSRPIVAFILISLELSSSPRGEPLEGGYAPVRIRKIDLMVS